MSSKPPNTLDKASKGKATKVTKPPSPPTTLPKADKGKAKKT